MAWKWIERAKGALFGGGETRDEWRARLARETDEAVASCGAKIDLSAAPGEQKPLSLSTLGIDWSIYDDRGRDMILLGFLYRCRHSVGDRRSRNAGLEDSVEVVDGQKVYNPTGIPNSPAALEPLNSQKGGFRTALETTLNPRKTAECLILRDDDGTPFANVSCRDIRDAKQELREDEKLACDELEARFKVTFARWVDRGWMRLGAVVKYSERDTGLGADGLPEWTAATPAAIQEAERVIPGTPFAKGPSWTPEENSTQERLSQLRKFAPWVLKEMKQQRRVGT